MNTNVDTTKARQLVAVSRVHSPDVAAFIADRYPAALPMLADGWTIDGALAHLDGVCDRTVCTADHA